MMNLRKVLFWDTDYQKINWEKHAPYVVERVVMYGILEEWRQVLDYYGKEKIIEIVRNLRHLDKKTLNYLSIRLVIPKEQFKCYTQMQSALEFYPY